MLAVWFGHAYVARPGADPGLSARVRERYPRVTDVRPLHNAPPLSTADHRVCNITGTVVFDTALADGLPAGIRPRALPPPWAAHTVSTIFGNLCFRPHAREALFSGVRRARHVLALARLLHRGQLRSIALHRFDVDASLGRHVQVTHECFMENAGRALFGGLLLTVPRTEELANIVILQFPDVAGLVAAAAALGLVAGEGAVGARWESARGAAQVTRSGHVKLRLNWPEALAVRPDELSAVQDDVRRVCALLTEILRALC
jgi:hypothetical protein